MSLFLSIVWNADGGIWSNVVFLSKHKSYNAYKILYNRVYLMLTIGFSWSITEDSRLNETKEDKLVSLAINLIF